jgi:hypothetical protein
VVWSEGGGRTDSLVWALQLDCWSGLTKSDGLNGRSGGFRRTDWTIGSSDLKVVWVLMNRCNLFYMVYWARGVSGVGSLLEEGVWKAKDVWEKSLLLDWVWGRIILYVHTKEDVAVLAELLCCLQYTLELGMAEQKEALLHAWLALSEQLYIMATSALSVGFNYMYVCLVIYVNELSSLVDFA